MLRLKILSEEFTSKTEDRGHSQYRVGPSWEDGVLQITYHEDAYAVATLYDSIGWVIAATRVGVAVLRRPWLEGVGASIHQHKCVACKIEEDMKGLIIESQNCPNIINN